MWTQTEEDNFAKLTAQMNGLKAERSRYFMDHDNAVTVFVRGMPDMGRKPNEAGIIADFLIRNRKDIEEFFATLPPAIDKRV